jgi:clusterin-associated protein 1
LNTKKLYQADGYAVKEILKVITPLYQALRESENRELDEEEDIDHQYRYTMNEDVRMSRDRAVVMIFFVPVQISTLKNARLLCSTITQKGANLYELLGKEIDARVRSDCSNTTIRDDLRWFRFRNLERR